MEVGDDGVSSNYLQQNDGRNESEIRCCSWKWWNDKLIDMNEAKNQVLFSVPMIITNICYYFIPLISVMFAGHLGELQLASSNLANSWATVTGFAFMVGLSGALETLCGQGYGAKLYGKLGIYLQTSCIISIVFCFFISILWIYTEPILILFHQDPQISMGAALYIKYLIPGLFAFGFLHNILRFLQTQSVVTPLAVCSVISTAIHIGVTHVLVHRTSLGYTGAPLAASVSLWISVFMLASYVLFAKKFNRTWEGFSLESFSQVFGNLKLALTSAAMFCLEDWAFELLVLLAGLMPNADKTTSVIAMCVNTETITFMFAYGLSASTSTRVSNELGAGNSNRAKQAMKVALKLSVIVALVIVLVLVFGHDLWAASFSDSSIIIQKYASMTPFLLISIVLDCIQGILSGVARGCGWQHLAVYINLTMFYLIGMPIAAVLGFKLKLYAKGLWIGLICGLCCQAVSLMLLTRFGAWKKMEVSENRHKEIRVLDTWTQVVELTENTEREIKVVV